jgi:hypothetical protein
LSGFGAIGRLWLLSPPSPLLACAEPVAGTAGSLKIVYDFLLLAQFRHLKPPEER